MIALVKKDLYVLVKQMKLFLLFILVFSLLPSTSTHVFAVVYASMLPYTAMAYDERSKWDQLAAMLPYSTRDMVLSKFVLGWMFIAGAAGLSLVARTVTAVFTHQGADVAATFLYFCVAVLLLAVTLPLMFRFGVEKGRALMIFIVVAGAISSASAMEISSDASFTAPPLLALVLPVAAVVGSFLSVNISMRLYARRRR